MPKRTAQLYMRIAERGLKSETVALLGLQAAAGYATAEGICEHWGRVTGMLIGPVTLEQQERWIAALFRSLEEPRDRSIFLEEWKAIWREMTAGQRTELSLATPEVARQVEAHRERLRWYELAVGQTAAGQRKSKPGRQRRGDT